MKKVSEDNLVVGVEYYLDSLKHNKGIFVEIDGTNVFFKPTQGESYVRNTEGLVSFRVENYTYETV